MPSRHSDAWPRAAVAYALCREDGSTIRDGHTPIDDLALQLAVPLNKLQFVLLISAADVTMLDLSIPPMSEARLKQALPNLVEDHLMGEVKECVLIAGTRQANGKRSVAVVQRDWLNKLAETFYKMGVVHLKALPAQLAVPWTAQQTSVWVNDSSADSSLTMRTGEETGVGMLQHSAQSIETWLGTISLLAPVGPISLQLPSRLIDGFRTVLGSNASWSDRITIAQSRWSDVVQSAQQVRLNLIAGLQGQEASRIQWKMWRLPLVLGALVLFANIAALNYDYWNMKREARSLQALMQQTYRTSFPKDTVVIFPIDQMRKNLETAERIAGTPSADDFTLLLTQFGSAWSSLNPASLPKLVSIEYKDRALLLQINGALPQKELQSALDQKGLLLKKLNADVWQIRNPT